VAARARHLPGLTETSLVPLAQAAGSSSRPVRALVELALAVRPPTSSRSEQGPDRACAPAISTADDAARAGSRDARALEDLGDVVPSSLPTPTVVVFDIGEVLIDETRVWAVWAELLGVSPLTFAAVLGAAIVQGEDHTSVFPTSPQRRLAGLRGRARAPLRRVPGGGPLPDARPCLAELRDLGFRVVIAGNQPARRTAQLEALDLPHDAHHLGGARRREARPGFFTASWRCARSTDPARCSTSATGSTTTSCPRRLAGCDLLAAPRTLGPAPGPARRRRRPTWCSRASASCRCTLLAPTGERRERHRGSGAMTPREDERERRSASAAAWRRRSSSRTGCGSGSGPDRRWRTSSTRSPSGGSTSPGSRPPRRPPALLPGARDRAARPRRGRPARPRVDGADELDAR
jgi:hypothetical protein